MRAAPAYANVAPGKETSMSTMSHEPTRAVAGRRPWAEKLLVREIWAALAIAVIWLAVLFTAVSGPDIVSTTAGAGTTTVPSVVVVALFAFLATWAVARYGFDRRSGNT